MRYFEHLHEVSFIETNLVGNVYFAHYLRWQGRCREMFLKAHAPDVLARLQADLRLVTTRCGCEYFEELRAFDTVAVRMYFRALGGHRLAMDFEYVRIEDGGETVAARGEQEVACMCAPAPGAPLEPCALPRSLRDALEAYQP